MLFRSLQSAAWLLDRHWWSNPAPMVLGIFIKSLLGSRSHLQPASGHAHADGHGHHPPGWIVASDLAFIALLLGGLWLMLPH